MSSPRILVTGGAGFIGSALIWALNQQGHENILVTDSLGTDEKWKNLVALKFADYLDASDLLELVINDPEGLGKFDFIYHLGANSATTERDAHHLMKNNFEYTKILAHWALDTGARFVYASSAATYGDGAHGMDDKIADITNLRPLNMYGYSKHLFDLYAQRAGIDKDIVGLKYFNVYGPNENHKGDMRSVVNKAFDQIRDHGKVQLFKSHHPDYKDGEQMRDFLYVKDAVAMTLFLGNNPDAGGLYNLGSGKAHTWLQLVNAIFEALNLPPNIEFIDMPATLQAKYQYYTCADINKLQSAGYNGTTYVLTEAVRDYVQNYLAPNKLLGD
ncbi:ADP-glyceromanno-heptose 6-epimerase [Phragmitibacter flavus]|uniref:ADP-L-glycero-D-manno-heptose-6-epimerase n=1 Tax=Phragmitibacter flavus TaxID=2576071 RepID=A0A5R8KDK9_9BACT|nr:ADP-glyceromanno-heptose 6-epimerase [Phragmitibacter flavus]TLD70393.1 ADP-glyceromanno-heptose 6-epimerase [Phragmitibacter flavus]